MDINRQYIALIGDLVASRELPTSDRYELQERLAAHLGAVGSHGNAGIASLPLLTLGDEFQALFHADDAGVRSCLGLISSIQDLARPSVLRFGLGVGGLSTPLRERALGMDGPCLHRARRALERSHSSDLPCQLVIDDGPMEALWGTLACYALRQRQGWTEPQSEAIELYTRLGAWKAVAAELGVSAGAVSLRQRAAGWSLYQTAWSVLEKGLISIVNPVEGGS